MTERAKQFIDDLRGVAKEHNQTVTAYLYHQVDTRDYRGKGPDLWYSMGVTIDPVGTVKKIVPFARIRSITREQWEREEEKREVITDQQLAGPDLVLKDEVPSEAR